MGVERKEKLELKIGGHKMRIERERGMEKGNSETESRNRNKNRG